MFEVERLTQAVRASGVTMSTSEETLFADLQALGRRYAKIKPSIQHLQTPVHTLVASSDQKIFMGDVTTGENRALDQFHLESGQLVVKGACPLSPAGGSAGQGRQDPQGILSGLAS